MNAPVTLVEAGTVERLWAYLTESKKRATWLAGGEFELQVGGRIRLEPMRLLAFTWQMSSADTEVSFELTPRGKEVQLVIVHRRLDGRDLTVSVMSGWDVHTGILADVLNGVEPRPFWKTHGQLEKQYAAAL